MFALKRASLIAAMVGFTALSMTAPALAGGWYGDVDCGHQPEPGCELLAGGTGSSPGPEHVSPAKPTRPGNSGGGPDEQAPGDMIIGSDPSSADCSYVKSNYQPPANGVTAAAYQRSRPSSPAAFASFQRQAGQGQGAWYVWKCTGEGVADALYRPPVWIPDGEQPGAELLPSPAELAQVAHQQLRLPAPAIATNPAGDQLVNLPTWMWLSGGWGPVSATASVPGVSVTAVATPTSVTWAMGDGSTVTCTSAGTPYKGVTDPRAPSPDCGHVYRRSSASQPGQAYPVTATVHWTVTWPGAGQGGTFPDMTTTGNATFRVAESQALNNGGG